MLRPRLGQQRLQRAAFAVRNLPTMVLADLHDQRVERVVVLCQLRLGCKRGECGLYLSSQLFVRCCRGHESMALEQSLGVGVHYKDRQFAGIEKDCVRGLWSNAIQVEEFRAQLLKRPSEHARQRSTVSLVQISDECFQSSRLLPEVAGGTHKLLEFTCGDASNGGNIQRPGSTQIAQRPLNIFPTRVLRKKSADYHLEARASRPPV